MVSFFGCVFMFLKSLSALVCGREREEGIVHEVEKEVEIEVEVEKEVEVEVETEVEVEIEVEKEVEVEVEVEKEKEVEVEVEKEVEVEAEVEKEVEVEIETEVEVEKEKEAEEVVEVEEEVKKEVEKEVEEKSVAMVDSGTGLIPLMARKSDAKVDEAQSNDESKSAMESIDSAAGEMTSEADDGTNKNAPAEEGEEEVVQKENEYIMQVDGEGEEVEKFYPVDVMLLCGSIRVTLELSPADTVADVRQLLSDTPESCYYTCFGLVSNEFFPFNFSPLCMNKKSIYTRID